ncbi:MAG: preprotein translocase subunit SecG [Candidatus Harrisonbacteria bacterium RIFCSPLOWO2_01_FULL_40_28]|uniref:Protein-export membrane protein SecG n=2 Tax=Candidatus Harrisoniibacteriota TaxID=1817905 RepID=A0A1G1ZVD7_9BACT|nr:MAG: preprotein translocase subunit SecG [Candidatus Harrisonbacteria bacterium RIFCSPLOWO2_01_FULL_40_28]OGY68542.1 MAG: preprotein translocase subunit SecG [Candidatus Harrisonbacteria bacterium RIFOXYD1_FULL_40_9]
MNSIFILETSQFIVALIIIALVLLQEGDGLSGVFGGTEAFHVRRGLERFVFTATIVSFVVFVGLSIANLVF